MAKGKGPLAGVKVVEFAGLGPGPFAAMLLSDLGADIVRIARKGAPDPMPFDVDQRGRRCVEIDLKDPASVEIALRLAEKAELLIEGFRPGVMERLGLGPEVIHARNPALVYGRMTGWGQNGPYAKTAGHDLNYLAISGGLHAIGTAERPVVPLNLAADYGGGAMFLVSGLLAALLHARATGEGQVVDVGMSDNAAYLMTIFYAMFNSGNWHDERESNIIDGGAPFYGVYRCADGKWISIGSIEPQFYALLIEKTGANELTGKQNDQANWPERREILQRIFQTKSREEWCTILEGTDVCFAPVLSLQEAPGHPHNVARETFTQVDGQLVPSPAPRFSRTPASIQGGVAAIERDPAGIMADWGID